MRDSLLEVQHQLLLLMKVTYAQVVQQIKNTSDTQLNEAGLFNNQVSAITEMPLINDQQINEIDILYQESGAAGIENRFMDILNIALQCPYQGGPSVYRARYFVSLFNDSLEYDDDAVCLSQGILRKKDKVKHEETACLQLYPNPAKDQVEVRWTGTDDAPIRIRILYADGRIAMERNISKANPILSLTALPPGLYMAEAIDDDFIICTTKLAIIR